MSAETLPNRLKLLWIPDIKNQRLGGDVEESAALQGVYLQSDGVPSVDSRIHWKGRLPTLFSATICFHLYLYHSPASSTPIVSYSVKDFPDETVLRK